ncbi:hypothetical protein [Pseudomonas fluorescens]|uniref:hypothetical protein n=1 Tax=Pseudomonas fluorescens TaxID=294 RepID=UPI003D248F8E
MSEDRVVALEIALKTVMAVAGRQGVEVDALCRKSIGAIIGDPEFNWVKPDHAEDAIAEIEMAQAAIAHLSLPSAK